MTIRKLRIWLLLLLLCSLSTSLVAQQSKSYSKPPEGIDRGLCPATKSQVVIYGVPSYLWRHGCGPTALGMVIGFWDASGYPALIPGNATTQTGQVDAAIADDSESPVCNGPTSDHYQDYACPRDASPGPLEPDRSETGGAHTDNCLADFMLTSRSAWGNYYGWSWFNNISSAFVDYVNMVYPAENVSATDREYDNFSWSEYKAEIDARRPVVLLVDTEGDGETDHFVTGIGYDDATIKYGIYDTWDRQVHWYAWRRIAIGREWGIFGVSTFSMDVVCFDSDGDGLGDPDHPENTCMVDNCPDNFNPAQEDVDGDGLGDLCDPDIDGDLIANGEDNCPYEYNPTQDNSDTDSVGDVCDNCVLVYNPDQYDENNDGIGDACDGYLHIHCEDFPDTIYLDQYFEYDFFAVGATAPYSWSHSGGDLPFGLTFEGGTVGRLYGTPGYRAMYFFNVACHDSDNPAVCDTIYSIRVRVDSLPPQPLCGDADDNGIVNISDAVFLIAYIFGGGNTPDPLEQADSDCNGIVNVSDAVYLIAYIFGGGAPPCYACPRS